MLRPLSAICFVLWAIALPAQTFDRSMNYGFENSADVLAPLTGGRWLVAGRGNAVPGGTFSDTIFAIVFDDSADVLLQKRMNLPNWEVRHVLDALGTPDGGFLITADIGLCDANFGQTILQKFDAAGQLQWSRESEAGYPIVERLRLAPDGLALGFSDHHIFKFDPADATVLWNIDPGNEFTYVGSHHFELIPGTEDLAMAFGKRLRIWKQVPSPNGPTYSLGLAEDLGGQVTLDDLTMQADGWAYAFDGTTKFVRFHPSLGVEILPNLSFKATDFFPASDGFLFLVSAGDRTLVLHTDTLGQSPDTLLNSGIGLRGLHGRAASDTVIVAGVDVTGKSPFDLWDGNATNVWLHTQVGKSASASWGNIGIAAVEQLAPITVYASTSGGPFPPYYTLTSVDFRVQVTNFGNVPVDHFYVSHAFGWAVAGFCGYRPVTHLRFDGPTLAPGESCWLDMGKIGASDLTTLPSEYCFWTSAPNGRPDDDHLDDNFCHSIVLDAETPAAPIALSITPNPTGSEGFWLTLPSITLYDNDLAYRLFDAMGRLVVSGQLAPGEVRQHIPTTQLPDGLYTLHAGKWKARVAVQR